METTILIAVLGVIVIAASSVVAPRIGTASPLVLLAAGLAISLLPFTPDYDIDPEVILAGLLPPLLYSAAVNMPAMDFRRDFRAISGLSVLLVVVSALSLGGVFTLLVDDLDYPLAVALGAIVSPTDAVATSIVKRLGVAPRVVTVLEGESLFNDATALVLLRTAVAATAAGVGIGGVVGAFAWAVIGAVAIGWFVGWSMLRVRQRIDDPAVSTALSFTLPFIAFLPAEHLEASGLVAAVTAGLVTGHGQVHRLGPQQRLSDRQNWRTVEVLAEGLVFLVMGLQVSALVRDVENDHGGVLRAFVLAVVALTVALAIRALYVVVIVWAERRRRRRSPQLRETIDQWSSQVRRSDHPRAARLSRRLRRASADVDFYDSSRLGRREGAVLVWAGLRGAVTLAAAQTLPTDAPGRSLLVLVAFFVALLSLVVQGGTLGRLVAALGLGGRDEADEEEWARLDARLREVAAQVLARTDLPAGWEAAGALLQTRAQDADLDLEPLREFRRAVIEAQRELLLRERADGAFSSGALTRMLAQLDADQIGLEMRQP